MRKFLIPALATALVIGLVIAGTWAFFSDTETSSGNTFTAGTLVLKLKVNGGWVDGVTATWTGTNMAPGDDLSSAAIWLRSFGTIGPDHLEVGCSYTSTESPADNMAKYLEITLLRYENDGWYINGLTGERREIVGDTLIDSSEDWKVDDTDGVGGVSLYDLKADPLDNLPPPDGSHGFTMGLKFNENAGNNLQGDTLNATLIFTLNQDASQ